MPHVAPVPGCMLHMAPTLTAPESMFHASAPGSPVPVLHVDPRLARVGTLRQLQLVWNLATCSQLDCVARGAHSGYSRIHAACSMGPRPLGVGTGSGILRERGGTGGGP